MDLHTPYSVAKRGPVPFEKLGVDIKPFKARKKLAKKDNKGNQQMEKI